LRAVGNAVLHGRIARGGPPPRLPWSARAAHTDPGQPLLAGLSALGAATGRSAKTFTSSARWPSRGSFGPHTVRCVAKNRPTAPSATARR